MSRIITFNVAQAVFTPYIDINGNIVANPTPIIVDGIQGFDLMLKGSIKQLSADKQFAIAGARGEGTVDGKLKAVKNSAEIISTLYSGQGWDTTTLFESPIFNQTGTVTVGTPDTLVVGPAASGVDTGSGTLVLENLGAVDQNGNALICMADPGSGVVSAGHYFFSISSGTATYSFRPSDIVAGLVPYVSVLVSNTTASPSTAKHLTINNVQGGSTPVLKILAHTSFQGRKMTLILPYTISSNLNLLTTKNLEFSGYEIDFSCFPDQTIAGTIVKGFFLE